MRNVALVGAIGCGKVLTNPEMIFWYQKIYIFRDIFVCVEIDWVRRRPVCAKREFGTKEGRHNSRKSTTLQIPLHKPPVYFRPLLPLMDTPRATSETRSRTINITNRRVDYMLRQCSKGINIMTRENARRSQCMARCKWKSRLNHIQVQLPVSQLKMVWLQQKTSIPDVRMLQMIRIKLIVWTAIKFIMMIHAKMTSVLKAKM